MSNTSATGGYLTPPVSVQPKNDALEDFLHDVIAGITGLSNELIRPRWQREPPDLPADFDSNNAAIYWCAFGVTYQDGEFNSYARHVPAGNGNDDIEKHEDLEVLCSFYGPDMGARQYAEYWRDGLQVAQNLEQLQIAKWGLTSTGRITPVPTLVKDRWLYRSDIPVVFRRLITNTYPVLNLLSAQVILYTDIPPTTQTLLVTDPPTP